jgi:two-component system sensor histidine kinase QseC
MSIQRRLLLWLLAISAGLWALTGVAAYLNSRHEINELFDTQQVRLAEQVLAQEAQRSGGGAGRPATAIPADRGEAEPEDMVLAIWDADGRPLWRSDATTELPYRATGGFERMALNGAEWIVFYLRSADGRRTVAAGELAHERDELLEAALASQMVPWALILPVLALSIWMTVRIVFRPLRQIAESIGGRSAGDLHPIPAESSPRDIRPLIDSMNALFGRIAAALEHERRLTADASHELRTPLAALRAQWDAATMARDEATRARAMAQIGPGFERLSRLVEQLLSLSELERPEPQRFDQPIDWRRVVETVASDVLPLVEARDAELQVDWPDGGIEALPLLGSEALLVTMLRNLVDNAVRYGPRGNRVRLQIGADEIEVVDAGPGLPPAMHGRIGARFARPAGQAEPGSGIGLSIVRRIAELHGLRVSYEPAAGGGLRVRIRR